jgi:hypothetical protein
MGARAIVLILVGAFGLAGSASAGTYSGGTGEPNDPYRIATANDLNDIGNHVEDFNKCFVMVNDINLADYNGTQFNIIGPNSTTPFTGIFDGNDKVIHNFRYESTGVDIVGLFGSVSGDSALIENLGLVAADVNGGAAMGIGSLVGHVSEATISGCYCVDCNVSGGESVGGLVGMNVSGAVSDCYATGQVEADETVGGLSGFNGSQVYSCYASVSVLSRTGGAAGGLIGFQNANGRTWACHATGAVRGLSNANTIGVGGFVGGHYGITRDCHASGDAEGAQAVGGFAGASFWDSDIVNCYATGSATGTEFVGGLAGYGGTARLSDSYAMGSVTGNEAAGGLLGINLRTTVSNCYAVGAVVGDSNVGGLVGLDGEDTWAGTFAACFWDSDVNPDVNGIGNKSEPNVVGKSTGEMQLERTFTDAGWDFVEVWDIGENQTYPFLRVYPAGDLNHDGIVDFRDVAILAGHWLEER